MLKTDMLTMKNACTKVIREEEQKIAVISHVVSTKLLKKEQLSIPGESVQPTKGSGKIGCWDYLFDSTSPLCSCCILLEKHHPEFCQE
jgi:hypothetical protein